MHLLHYAMQEVMREGTAKRAYQVLPSDFSVAGKTGTTNDLRDSWFAGFSGDLLAVSWIGRDDNGPTGLTGSSGALRVWSDFMAHTSNRPLAYRVPADVTHHWIDSDSGRLSEEGCEGARLLPFIEGSAPQSKVRCAQSKDKKTNIKEWFKDLFSW
jgi:penicillin-binding protein 1B